MKKMEDIDDYEILNKVSKIDKYTEGYQGLTIYQVANYYNTNTKTIDTVLRRNRDEFHNDELQNIAGDELKTFKILVSSVSKNVPSLLLLSYKSIIRMSFKLQNNNIACKIREDISNNYPSLYEKFMVNNIKLINKKYELELKELIYSVFSKYHKIDYQYHIDNYILDFLIDNKIVVECDENGHSSYDINIETSREKYILDNGYKILRYDTRCNNMLNFIGEISNELCLLQSRGEIYTKQITITQVHL